MSYSTKFSIEIYQGHKINTTFLTYKEIIPNMNIYIILGIIAIIFSPATGIGMLLNDATYWLIWDIAAIIIFPIIGYALVRAGMNLKNP
ncbi:MAG: hypothetical protein OXC46_04840 [Thaumarchaeota archaeon]|nr:hypothetical protein [Nitrososphaerota archaeon]